MQPFLVPLLVPTLAFTTLTSRTIASDLNLLQQTLGGILFAMGHHVIASYEARDFLLTFAAHEHGSEQILQQRQMAGGARNTLTLLRPIFYLSKVATLSGNSPGYKSYTHIINHTQRTQRIYCENE